MSSLLSHSMRIMEILSRGSISMTKRMQDLPYKIRVDKENQAKAADADCGHKVELRRMILTLVSSKEMRTSMPTLVNQGKHKELVRLDHNLLSISIVDLCPWREAAMPQQSTLKASWQKACPTNTSQDQTNIAQIIAISGCSKKSVATASTCMEPLSLDNWA